MHILISLILPALMLVLSFLLMKFPPKEINSLVGYRTQRSMKSQQAWEEANRYSTRLLFWASCIALGASAASAAVLGLRLASDDLWVASLFLSIGFVLAELAVMIVYTEKHLKKQFGG
jgi:uncharacterized membrane protein